MRRYFRSASIVLLAALAFGVGWVRLPYFAIGPGPPREVTPLIRIEGHPRYESSGHLVMTTVRYYQVTPLRALFAWIDPTQDVVPRKEIFLPGETVEQEQRRAVSDMDQSKIDAAYVALRQVTGYPKEHGAGALIESTVSDCPADGKLFPGDLVRAIDGDPITSERDASRAIRAAPPKVPLTFRITVNDETHDIDLSRTRCVEDAPPLVGVRMVDRFPFAIQISSGDVGGPSAGLMWGLGLYDLLTPGDLTGGRTIAGTGTIDLEGHVGPIGGIDDKVVAAERSGASIFLVPAGNLKELEGVDTGDMRVVSVSTFQDALDALGDTA